MLAASNLGQGAGPCLLAVRAAEVPGPRGHDEYELTAKSLDLWSAVRSLMTWGDGYYSAKGPRRLFSHAADGGEVPVDGTCMTCGAVVAAADLMVVPGTGWEATGRPTLLALPSPDRTGC